MSKVLHTQKTVSITNNYLEFDAVSLTPLNDL